MYRGFSLKIDDPYCTKVLEQLDFTHPDSTSPYYNFMNPQCFSVTDKYPIKSILEKNIVNTKTLNADKIKGDWFPIIESDVFISHSHKDLNMVKKISKILSKHLKLKVFVDSEVWKYSDDLVQQIEQELHESGYPVHDKIVSHVNIMLASALTKMVKVLTT